MNLGEKLHDFVVTSSIIFAVDNKFLNFTTIEGDVGRRLDKMFGVKPSFLRVEPGHCLLPPQFVFHGVNIRDMEIYDDDVWMISYPRTGKIRSNLYFIFYIYTVCPRF